jgi:rifampicin phosphotransferase
MMRYVLLPTDQADRGSMGGKAAALARLSAGGFDVPAWVVIRPDAPLPRDHRKIEGLECDTQEIPGAAPDPQETKRSGAAEAVGEIAAAVRRLAADGSLLAVRSSAMAEDGASCTFAGQFESYLDVPAERVLEHVARVRESAASARVRAYRIEHGLDAAVHPPAVIVQRMVPAKSAGVAFMGDPANGRRSVVVVCAVEGLGNRLVDGSVDGETWRIDRADQIMERCSAAGPDAEPVLSDEQVLKIADLVRHVSRYLGRPQDIEWAIDAGNRLHLLQARPITTLAAQADPDGALAIWDNSNIAESYSGITTPLTFSFARRAYEGVYRQFCRIIQVPRETIESSDWIFRNMLGLIRGRVYYNLLNWYRLVAMLPGFASNRQFMEQMMGVRERLPEQGSTLPVQNPESRPPGAAPEGRATLRDRIPLLRAGFGMLINHLTLPRRIRRFGRRLDEALRPPAVALEEMRLDELVAEFERLERALLRQWDAPIVNDFLAMIFFGVLGRLCNRWCAAPGLHNALVSGEGGIISAEPARRIARMGAWASGDASLVAALCEAPAEVALRALSRHPRLLVEYQAYLDRFADRCLEELKLESATLLDDATPLLRAIGHAAQRGLGDTVPARVSGPPREQAEHTAGKALRQRPLRRLLFSWVLRHARRRVRDRENLRFERTRVFGRVRRVFVEMARRLVAEGRLGDERDVFYLEVHELLGFVRGCGTCDDLAHLAAVRRNRFDQYRQMPAPADRFDTRGAVFIGNGFGPEGRFSSVPAGHGHDLRGTGCCPGVVRGPVRVVRDPASATLKAGEVLVAERTDPGWIMLFPAAAGILVERGSLLSHSAIVARELRIPTIVAIAGLTRRLQDGQWVVMDGASGVIQVIDEPAESAKPDVSGVSA